MSKPLLIEFGMGTSLRRADYTEAAARAIRDALWHNSINLAELFDKPKEAMSICAVVGVQKPEEVDAERLKTLFPYGKIFIHVSKGGLDVPRPGGGTPTIIANVALKVNLEGVE
ncbi:MAG: Lin0512 family protein [Pseudomonadota bacterium]